MLNWSKNYVFGNGEMVIMVVWSEGEVVEEFFFGMDVIVMDVWGCELDVLINGNVYLLLVFFWLFFVFGMDFNVVKFCMGFEFGEECLVSVFGYC